MTDNSATAPTVDVALPVDDITLPELQLAARNHGFPLEALAHDITPVGLHYLLIHFDIPQVDTGSFRLKVDGCVSSSVSLTLDDVRAMPVISQPVTLECAGNGRALSSPRAHSQPWLLGAVGTGLWTGTPLAPLLREVGLRDDALEVVFTGLDRGFDGGQEQVYQRSLPVAECEREQVMLAYELNGAPLPPQHGFPLRLVVPAWYGMASVKWLERITAVDEPFTGYQQANAYRFRRSADDDDGPPVQRIVVRSLLQPPGIPDFFTRRRFVEAGPVAVSGRAWSGSGAIMRVELSPDGGTMWQDAELFPAAGPHAWHRFTATWNAAPGEYELCSRATDESGATQPLTPTWNVGGYGNNAVQRVPVTVRP